MLQIPRTRAQTRSEGPHDAFDACSGDLIEPHMSEAADQGFDVSGCAMRRHIRLLADLLAMLNSVPTLHQQGSGI